MKEDIRIQFKQRKPRPHGTKVKFLACSDYFIGGAANKHSTPLMREKIHEWRSENIGPGWLGTTTLKALDDACSRFD